ncbi:FAD-dependent oxidoreductase [Dietzia alimentaria]|uniref:FAD-dependent oxidoreductase n=1 Tax=Dietzia alimentaria TaxID=665550 RepID=UPI00029A2391|nr:FAD-dependent oxidoreductase [Dietzia alimentaria]
MTDTASDTRPSLVTADVVVVGMGIAGACAAIEAAEAGSTVIVLEGASGPGGSSAQSGGEVYLGGGTSTQRALGIDDTVEDMRAFLMAALGPNADEAKIDAYCTGAVEHHDWLVSHGAVFHHKLWDTPTWMPGDDSGLMWMGERAEPYASIARPAARGHRPPAPNFAGNVLMDSLVVTAEKVGVTLECDIKVRSLIVEEGRVVGVRATEFGVEREYRANSGVVLATGGFVDNERMVEQWAPQQLGKDAVSDGRDDGSGIEMGMEIGAAVRRMHQTETAMLIIPRLVVGAMLVDGDGQRFINEEVYPGLYCHAAVHHRRPPVWVIIDEKGIEDVPESELWGMQPMHAAETIEELAADCGLPVDALADQLRRYNAGAENGEDPQFGKSSTWVRPLEPPFGAYPTGAGGPDTFAGLPLKAQGFTLGGLHTDLDSRVLDHAGEPIPGLFAAGRCTHGLHGEGYISGTSLGDGSFFGRRAGRGAAGSARA